LLGTNTKNSGGYYMGNFIVKYWSSSPRLYFFLTISPSHARNAVAARWYRHKLLFGGGSDVLSPSAIAAIPTYTYQRDMKHGGWAQCVICLSFLEEREMVGQLPECKHLFHVECIDK
jgi:RING-like zinc finger